jgi:hypothetical protein
MTKASDNAFPSLLITEGTEPAAPAAGKQRLYIDSTTHKLKRTDSSGVDVTIEAGSAPAGSILQVVTASSTANDTTTSVTAVDSSLSLAITPQASTSKLLVFVSGECTARRVAGTIAERDMYVEIYNSTNSVSLVEHLRGGVLIGTSSAAAPFVQDIGLMGTYTVNSTAARTFKLRYRSAVVTNVQGEINGSAAGPILMTIMEIAV